MYDCVKELLDCIVLDVLPGNAVCTDFGIDKDDYKEVFGALQFAVKHNTCTVEELNEALGDGPALTEIVQRPDPETGRPNPYARVIKTAWDGLPKEEDFTDDYLAEDFDDESVASW